MILAYTEMQYKTTTSRQLSKINKQIDNVEICCEMFNWTQEQQTQKNGPTPLVLLTNDLIDMRRNMKILNYLQKNDNDKDDDSFENKSAQTKKLILQSLYNALIQQYDDLYVLCEQSTRIRDNAEDHAKLQEKIKTKMILVEKHCHNFNQIQNQQIKNNRQTYSSNLQNRIVDSAYQTTMLHWLSKSDAPETIKLLLQNKNINPNVRNSVNAMPIHYAIFNQQKSNIYILLQHGAQHHLLDTLGVESPLLYAMKEMKHDKEFINKLCDIAFASFHKNYHAQRK